jgi:hypothetical protein
MKTAQALVEDLFHHVMPPLGLAIVLNERPSKYSEDPNWAADAGIMDMIRLARFNQQVAGLRKSSRLVDWTVSPATDASHSGGIRFDLGYRLNDQEDGVAPRQGAGRRLTREFTTVPFAKLPIRG